MLKIIDNFSGYLTRDDSGDMNSGLVKYPTSFGYDPLSSPGNLTWLEQPVQIDSGASVITDLIMAAKTRLESGITYAYAVGHTGRLYKIQVNNPATFAPDYDTPVLLTTLTINSPTFKYGSSIQFYGATEKIFVGHDKGVTKVNYDGTGEAFVGVLGSYTASVPRPSANFLGKLEFGNGTNLVEIDSTETVTSYSKLSPAFPSGTFVRDLDVTPDGNYLQIVVSHLNSPDLTSVIQDTTSLSSADSYKFLWNGTDTGYTSYESFSGYSLTSNTTFGPFSYTLGYDLGGAGIYTGGQKVESLPAVYSPNFGAMFSNGNMLGFMAPEYNQGNLVGIGAAKLGASIFLFGQYDEQFRKGLYRFLRINNTFATDEPVQIPVCLTVSNLFYGSSHSQYSNNVVGTAKLYYSVLGIDSNGNATYKFYRFCTSPTGSGSAIVNAVYETQNETSFKLFRSIISKKFKVSQVRLYTKPFVGGESFQIALIGADGQVMSGGSKIFSPSAGDDLVRFDPQTGPTYSVGVRITNDATTNWTGVKLELEYEEFGTT